jgi:hypothetical protein
MYLRSRSPEVETHDFISQPYVARPRARSLVALVFTAMLPIAFSALLAWFPVHPLGRLQPASSRPPSGTDGITEIYIEPKILNTGLTHFGMNVGGQHYWDAGQMLKNLVFRNPGFEGETWQSILHCKAVSASSCTDDNQYCTWPNGFLSGARYELLSGAGTGHTGTVRVSAAAGNGHGVTLSLADSPHGLEAGDYIMIKMEKPGDAQAGWWTATHGGATISTEFHDLAPATLGKQALRIDAAQPGQSAEVNSYFDTSAGESFIQLHGSFMLRFRAKRIAGNPKLSVIVERQEPKGPHLFFTRDVPLTSSWHDFAFPFSANEDGSAIGTVALIFAAQQTSVLLDDVELVPAESPAQTSANPTAFRDEVVASLRQLHPGILRFMDSGTSFGSTFDDLIAPPFARRRGGSQMKSDSEEDLPIGLEESLVLAQAMDADPWYTLPATTSPDEAAHLVEFLAGPSSTPYGARRSALGHPTPWTSVFHTIHLEFGDEMWNNSFAGTALADPAIYGLRASTVFSAARSSRWFNVNSFDLIADSQAVNPYWTKAALKSSTQANSISLGPYLFNEFNDASSIEAIFGSMFAEPEQWDTTGIMAQQADAARNASHPAIPEIYEVNLGTTSSANKSITQSDIDRTVPSVGAAIAVADHMLLMLRELGITTQCFFALHGSGNRGGFAFTSPGGGKTTPLWGAVIDMGGPTNLRRPTFFALELANQALLTNELTVQLTGANPTWTQPASTNDNIATGHPHTLQVFAFGAGARRSLILLNLSRTDSLPVRFASVDHPAKDVTESRLTAANITDSNEQEQKVAIVKRVIPVFDARTPYLLPPFSMTVLEWQDNWRSP